MWYIGVALGWFFDVSSLRGHASRFGAIRFCIFLRFFLRILGGEKNKYVIVELWPASVGFWTCDLVEVQTPDIRLLISHTASILFAASLGFPTPRELGSPALSLTVYLCDRGPSNDTA